MRAKADAWTEGEKMAYIKYGDLPFKVGAENILLFQPEITYSSENLMPTNRVWLENAYAEAMNLDLIHIGSLLCDGGTDELSGPLPLGPKCGGKVRWHLGTPSECLRLSCSNPNCRMDIRSNVFKDITDISNLIFHLMLKQMVPNLPTLNYVDCSKKQDGEGKKFADVRALGVISLALEDFWGFVHNGYFSDLTTSKFALGFMFAPGMLTETGCGGYDSWLQLLVEKKFEHLAQLHRSMTPSLIGPKSVRTK